jgi:hypothetical protein
MISSDQAITVSTEERRGRVRASPGLGEGRPMQDAAKRAPSLALES